MTITIGVPCAGERLFLAFVQPCLDARVKEGNGKAMSEESPRFSTETRDLYVAMWKTGAKPHRSVLRRDFSTPCSELVRFAADRGVVDDDQVWSHDMVADFWRSAHKRNDAQCRVIAATVLSTEYPEGVVSVLNDRAERMFAVNLLGIPIEEGDLVSVHKLIICERRT